MRTMKNNSEDRVIEEHRERKQLLHLGRFEGQVAIVTGGAQGMGAAIARRIVAEGGSVVIADIADTASKELVAQLGSATAVTTDVSNSGACDAMVAAAEEAFGGVDLLFACAGGAIIPPRKVWELSEDEWDFLVDVNLKGQWLCSKAVMPSMRRRGGGVIVNISSTGGLNGAPGMSAYGAAKAGLINLTKTMAQEFSPFGIRVNSVAPGFIRVEHPKTVFTEEQFDQMGQQWVKRQCIKRVGQTFDIANVATFLASSDADFISGQVIAVAGG